MKHKWYCLVCKEKTNFLELEKESEYWKEYCEDCWVIKPLKFYK